MALSIIPKPEWLDGSDRIIPLNTDWKKLLSVINCKKISSIDVKYVQEHIITYTLVLNMAEEGTQFIHFQDEKLCEETLGLITYKMEMGGLYYEYVGPDWIHVERVKAEGEKPENRLDTI